MHKKSITQNAQYTFKYNLSLGRHGWLRLTPAYSVRLVEEILNNLDYTPCCVMEPFSGTGTTELVCANKGISSFALDINPFLVWLGNAKLHLYLESKIHEFLCIANDLMENINDFCPAGLPPIHNIHRWWKPSQADFLARLKTAIKHIADKEVSQLLTIAFCRILIELSNAAFNHVSTSFKDDNNSTFSIADARKTFLLICEMIAKSAASQPCAASKVLLHDSRSIPCACTGTYDTVITSPPYPNRISYIRELRPYMYWLEYLETSEQAGSLDWKAIGGTWGRATSLLGTWKSNQTLPKYVYEVADKIAHADNKSAKLMANYVLKYFEDMHQHLASAYAGLIPKGKAFYIIGNSNFYGITVPAEEIYHDMMQDIGFSKVEHRIIRKRNCNKHLYEFVVSGQKA